MTARNCPECLRRTETDVIPAFHYGNTIVRPFELCTFCGFVYPEEEKA